MGRVLRVSGKLHRNDWFHDWLVENGIQNSEEAYKAAKNPGKLEDLARLANVQATEPIQPISGRSIVAGRSLDLTGYLACGHPDCLKRQVDDLFRRVWHYFDKIAIVGPEAHSFMELYPDRNITLESKAKYVAGLAQPIFHIRDIGAEGLVTWVSKPPACPVHWKEFEELEAYHFPEEIETVIAARLLEEGTVRLEKSGPKPRLALYHQDFFSGRRSRDLEDIRRFRRGGEPLEFTLARNIVQLHWAGTASDMYLANSMNLPVGLGIGLEARLADLRRSSVSPSEVAFKLVLPVVDGLPVKELLALRESENDAFEGFRDSLTEAIKEGLVGPEGAVEDVDALADELRGDLIDPALHRIQRRLRAAEGLLRKNYRYNIALAGLATICGIFTSPDIATAVAAVAMTGTGVVEAQFASEKRDIALDNMYFLWKAKEYAQQKGRASQRSKKRKR